MIVAAIVLAAAQPGQPAQIPAPVPHFAPMRFLIGHCWEGRFANGKIDMHCFEPVYDGKFLRDRHKVTGGYQGETLYRWIAHEGRAEYTYWNNEGGVSTGGMRARDGLLDFGDEVYRGRDGRETRIATSWRKLDDTSYEVRIASAADPTGSRVVRYTRVDTAPVKIEQSDNADGSRTLSHELVVPAPPEQVYAAFSTPEGWRTWAVPHAWTDKGDRDLMETSYGPAATLGDPNNIQQRFVLRVPSRLIVFRTLRTPPSFPHASEFQRVTSVVELEPVAGGTRVRLSGIGYPAGAAGDTLLGFFREGNRRSLEQLRARFVRGPVDWAAGKAGK